MEPLPTQGQTLRHYTASRPRPRRTHSQPPSSRTQEPVSKAENEASEGMGRVDEGVEEFFTKKIIPDYALKGRWEESNPAQATPSESSSTPSASTPFSSSSDNITISSTSTTVTSPSAPPTDTCFTSTDAPLLSTSSTPPTSSSITTTSTSIPTKNIKKKFGDFFAFKRARAGRAAKAGGGEGGGGGEAVKVKRTSIADLIRPLREAKERERERERDKEREKERGPRAVDDANVCNDAATTEGIAAPSHLTGDVRAMAPAKTLTTTTPSSEATPPHPATSSTPEPAAAAHTGLQEETVSSPPVLPGPAPSPAPCLAVTSPVNEQERLMMEMKVGGTPISERRLKVTKRSLREGKSQSLILLTGLEPDDKKHASENTPSFEQRLQVMLHRMGVAKTPPADTKMTQNKDEELRKANSEGAILDKPEPPPTYMKPRTMSTSSADPRHPIRTSDQARPEPLLYPKPALPERPVGPLPPKPAIAAKPHLPTPATAAGGGGGGRPSSAPPSSRPEDGPPQIEIPEASRGPALTPSPRKEPLPLAPSPWRVPMATDRSEKAQSVTDESLPKPRHHMKPLPQRRAVSVHEDAFAMTQELKAVLQRSPIRFRGNRGDLPTCTEDPSSGEEAQRPQEEPGEPKGSGIREDLKPNRVRMSSGSEPKPLSPPEEEVLGSRALSSTPQDPTDPPTVDTPPVPPRTTDKPPPSPIPQEKSSSTASETLQNTPLPQTPHCTSPTLPQTLQNPQISPQDMKSPGTAPPTVVVVNSTQEEGGAGSRQHTEKEEPADQRTESPVSE